MGLEFNQDMLSTIGIEKLDKNSYIGVVGYQDLLNQIGLKYGSKEALDIASKSMKRLPLRKTNYSRTTVESAV